MSLATNGGCDDRVSTNKSLCVFEVHTRGEVLHCVCEFTPQSYITTTTTAADRHRYRDR